MPSPRVIYFPQRSELVVACLLILLCFLLAWKMPIASAQREPCDWCSNEPPVADLDGPYATAPGTSVQLSGLASYDGDGWITSYFWDFGDGTTGTGQQPTHTYQAEGIYTIRLTVTDNNGASTTTETTVSVNAQTVRINFDNLPTGTIVTNQYEQVKFSATWFSGGLGGPTGYDIYTQPNYGSGGSTPNAIFSNYNPSWNNPMYARGIGNFYLDFPVPVNDFSFLMLNIFNTGFVGYADVYVNRAFYGTFYIYGAPGHGAPFVVNSLRGIPGITGIALINFSNYDQGYPRPVYLDDFTFTPDVTVNITSGRVNGILNGTTQQALVGADIALNASVLPAGRTGGTYSWTFTGPYVVLSPANSSAVNIRSTDTGTITARVTYTLNGASASTSVNINAVLPTLTEFTAEEVAERVAAGNTCGEDPPLGSFYVLGCPESLQGMTFSATAKVPEGRYLSDPAMSGIKYVQIVNSLRKVLQAGSVKCQTARTQESSTQTGWQLDTFDPSNLAGYPIRRFSEGNVLTMADADSPRDVLEVVSLYTNRDALYVDEIFETYIFYFVGNPATPIFQRAIGFENSGSPVARIGWGWGGLVIYDWLAPNRYRIVSSRTVTGHYAAQPASSVRSYSGNVKSLQYIRCPSGPDLTNNLIEGARFFVRQQYCDLYSREPDANGWNYWTSEITKCGFDLDCIQGKYGRRAGVAASFFYEAEAQRVDPDLANPPGTPGFDPSVYNPAFVRHCYMGFLRRRPEPEGLAFWVDSLNRTGDYVGVISAFISSTEATGAEYRNRPFRSDRCVTPVY